MSNTQLIYHTKVQAEDISSYVKTLKLLDLNGIQHRELSMCQLKPYILPVYDAKLTICKTYVSKYIARENGKDVIDITNNLDFFGSSKFIVTDKYKDYFEPKSTAYLKMQKHVLIHEVTTASLEPVTYMSCCAFFDIKEYESELNAEQSLEFSRILSSTEKVPFVAQFKSAKHFRDYKLYADI